MKKSKIIITLFVAIVALCFLLALTIAVLSPIVERAKPVFEVVTPVSEPTATVFTTPTEDPKIVGYRIEVSQILMDCSAYFDNTSELLTMVVENPVIVYDDNWGAVMSSQLDGIRDCGDNLLARRDVPPGFEKVDEYVRRAGAEYLLATDDIEAGLYEMDADTLLNGAEHMAKGNDLVDEAITEAMITSP